MVEFALEVADATLSGLLAEACGPEPPKALVVAIHGAGMHAGYFDTRTAPGLSLLELGSRLGFTVWAPDRPGIGVSAHLPDERITLQGQAKLLLDAIELYSIDHPVGDGVFLVGHSYGLKVAWAMSAQPRGWQLLGLDGSGSGVRYNFDLSTRARDRAELRPNTDRGEPWGPESLYPIGTFDSVSLPTYKTPEVQKAEGRHWPSDIRAIADQITIPMRLTYGQYERFWPIDEPGLQEVRAVFRNARRLSIDVEPFTGHNLSLGWAARCYHLKLLAFAESCVLSRRLSS